MAFTFRRRTLAVLLAGAVALAGLGVALGSVAADAPSHGPSGPSYQTGPASPPANNTTVQQENPSSVDSDGNVSALQTWLSGRLTRTTIDCSKGIEIGNYDACDRSSGDYPRWLGDYVNVTRSSESNANRTSAFEHTAKNQRNYAADVRRFRETVEQYHEARNDGNTQRARRLARRAQRISTEVNTTSANLTRNYRTIANGTGRNLSAATDSTETVTRNVTTTAETLTAEQFVDTTISATVPTRRISFRRPLRVTGRLTTANGTRLANEAILLEAGNRTRRTTTNGSGIYSITYRPTLVSLETDHVTLRYLPQTLSVYNSTATAVPVHIRQVHPKVVATASPPTVRFGDSVTADGRITVDGAGVGSVALHLSVGRKTLPVASGERRRSGSDGRFRFTGRLPKRVGPGRRPLRVSFPFTNRALGPATASAPVTVRPTPTALSIDATQTSVNGSNVGGPVIRVSGRLTADDGTPVRGESLALSANGTPIVAATTDRNGRYVANVTVPKQVFAGHSGTVSVSVVATYRGASTSLKPSRARTSLPVEVPAISQGVLGWLGAVFEGLPWYGWGGVAVVVVLVGYVVSRTLGRSRDRRPEGQPNQQPATGRPETAESNDFDDLLRTANEALFVGDQAGAVATAYTAVRTQLQGDLGLTTAYTHWEFLDACRSGLGSRRHDALQRLTELYEHATFSPYPLPDERATDAIEDARTVTDADDESRPDD